MTQRSDIEPNAKGWRGLSYTCRCGWVDWGHALPRGAMELKTQMEAELADWPLRCVARRARQVEVLAG